MRNFNLGCLAFTSLILTQPALAEWEPDPAIKKQVQIAELITKVQEKMPRTERYFEEAYAFAVLPSVTRIAAGFGGATGKGLVIEGDNAIGYTRFWQFSSGIQAGVKNFSMFLFFKDKEALEMYKKSELQFLGQAGVALANMGVDGTPSFNEGVALVTMTKLGLIAEFSYSGAKFSYKPIQDDR